MGSTPPSSPDGTGPDSSGSNSSGPNSIDLEHSGPDSHTGSSQNYVDPEIDGIAVGNESDAAHTSPVPDPFNIKEKPFFAGGQRQENLETLRHMVHFSDRILLLTGESGSGKTFLLERLCAYEEAALKIVRIKSELLQGSSSLLQQMADASGLPIQPGELPSELASRLKLACEKRFSNGFRTLFVIDNAHELSDDSVDMLIPLFRQDPTEAMGLLLLAQPQIIGQIQKRVSGFDRQPIYQIQLRNFTQTETTAYTEYYLENFGWDKSIALAADLQNLLREAGGGIPGRINRIASSVLLTEQSKPARPMQKPVYLFFGGTALAMVLALVLFVDWQGGESSSDEDVAQQTIKLSLPTTSEIKERAEEGAEEGPEPVISDIAIPDSNSDSTSEGAQIPGSEADLIGLESVFAEDKSNEGSELKAEDSKADASLPGEQPGSGEKSAGNKETIAETESEERQITEQTKKSTEKATAGVTTTAASSTSDAPAAEAFFRTTNWLNAQPRDGWTIQILGSHNEVTVAEFMQQFKPENDYYYVKSSYQGKEWFVALHGSYGSKDEARQALRSLPEGLRRAGAWIRSLAGLQSN